MFVVFKMITVRIFRESRRLRNSKLMCVVYKMITIRIPTGSTFPKKSDRNLVANTSGDFEIL